MLFGWIKKKVTVWKGKLWLKIKTAEENMVWSNVWKLEMLLRLPAIYSADVDTAPNINQQGVLHPAHPPVHPELAPYAVHDIRTANKYQVDLNLFDA